MILKGKSLLVVDDEDLFGDLMDSIFVEHGATVSFAQNLDEAGKHIMGQKKPDDLIILDYIFPGGFNGIDFYRQAVKPRNIPTILITGHATLNVAKTFLKLGGADVLHKPFEPTEIMAAARGILMGKHSESTWRSEVQIILETGVRGQALTCSFDAYDVIKLIGYMDREILVAILLDSQDCVIQTEIIAIGTVSGMEVHQREIFKSAIRHGASSIVIAHNHPSGRLEASHDDAVMTDAIARAGLLMGIPLKWHLLVANNAYIELPHLLR